jgi:hypothetical protein
MGELERVMRRSSLHRSFLFCKGFPEKKIMIPFSVKSEGPLLYVDTEVYVPGLSLDVCSNHVL